MLWFLSIAAKRKYCVDRYTDTAVGVMGRNAAGKEYVARVTLRPEVAFSGDRIPTSDELARAPPSGARGVLHRQFGADGDTLRAGTLARRRALITRSGARRGESA